MATLGSNLDGVRRANLAAVLDRVHHDGAVSRAVLTLETGLNRSTVAALVAELAALGLVVESEPPATNRVGRPSPIVEPDPGVLVLAVNPEVDAVTLAIVGFHARVAHRVRRVVDHLVTPDEVADIAQTYLEQVRADLPPESRIAGVGLAVPGLVARSGEVRWAPHLGWTDAPLDLLVAERTGLPTVAGNDAGLGAQAEHLFGVGRGIDDLVYLNGGASGIGGGVIAGGRALRGAGGFAGEFGHNRPGVADGTDRVSADGALEDEVSRARLLAVTGLADSEADESHLASVLLTATDPAVRAEIERQRRILATALSNAVNVLNPAAIVLGGFLAALLAVDPDGFDGLVAAQSIPAAFSGVRIHQAALGADRLMIGAAELALAPLLADPAGTTPSRATPTPRG